MSTQILEYQNQAFVMKLLILATRKCAQTNLFVQICVRKFTRYQK